MELVWRSLTTADTSVVAALHNAAALADGTGKPRSEQDFAESFARPGLAGRSVGVSVDGVLTGYGVFEPRDNPVGAHRVRLDGVVHPEFRRRGIGSLLMQRLISTAREVHRALHPAMPLVVCAMVETCSASHVALVEKLGFTADRHFHTLEVALGESLAQVPVPAGYEVVPYSPARDEEVRLASNEAFTGHWGSVDRSPQEWAESFTDSARFAPDTSFLALNDGAVVAFVLSRHQRAVEETTGVRELWIGDVGTLAGHRGRGVASALLSRTLTRGRAQGYQRAGLSVDAANSTGALGVYERAGFGMARTVVDYGLRVKPTG
ncbi:GNAT family N-acetyltransferase [Lentzea sp. NPDC059081]|uniref:GNAT family N-acetyltransferase n=1 Tax=Lentzea sp. NPDC059081 TaxID=3346719 RepID=UPI00367A476A